MNSIHSRVERAFKRLSGEAINEGFIPYVRIGPDVDIEEVRLGRGHSGIYQLWVRVTGGETGVAEADAGSMLPVELETLQTEDGGVDRFLRVSCVDPRLDRSFLSFVAEVLEEAETGGTSVVYALTRVLDSWRELLRSRQRELDRTEAIGLFGELLVLTRLATINAPSALPKWRGAENYRHDFSRQNGLEVKTYTASGAAKVQIHGVRQLEPATGHRLHLLALRVDENASGRTIADLVEELIVAGIPRGQLLCKMDKNMAELERATYRFIVEEMSLFEVGPDFPGIRPSALVKNALRGVDDVVYSLSLDSCPGSLPVDALQDVLENL